MGRRPLKQKAVAVDDLEFMLSNLEEDHSPANFVVDKVSEDRWRINRNEHTVQVNSNREDEVSSSLLEGSEYFISDFADINVDEFCSEKKNLSDHTSRKQRYISSVRLGVPLAHVILLICVGT